MDAGTEQDDQCRFELLQNFMIDRKVFAFGCVGISGDAHFAVLMFSIWRKRALGLGGDQSSYPEGRAGFVGK